MRNKKKTHVKMPVLAAAVAGLLTVPLTLTSCGKDDKQAHAAPNGCNGRSGCGANHDKTKDTNRCSGPNGCNGHGTKEADASGKSK